MGKTADFTEPRRREASGSKCKLLLVNIVKTQAGSNNSKQVWYGQDTRVILEQAWIFDRRTISRLNTRILFVRKENYCVLKIKEGLTGLERHEVE